MLTLPALPFHHLPPSGSLRASVILLHGYAASAVAQHDDGLAFRDDHTEIVMPDAPGHGARDDGRLARIAALPDAERRDAIRAIAREWLAELPGHAADCRRRGAERVALVGISMGGFAALGGVNQTGVWDAVAAVLAEPELVDQASIVPGEPPVLLGLAGRDEAIAAAPGRAFARRYGAELHEYPESEHFMRGADWDDLWGRTAAFVRRHLARAD